MEEVLRPRAFLWEAAQATLWCDAGFLDVFW